MNDPLLPDVEKLVELKKEMAKFAANFAAIVTNAGLAGLDKISLARLTNVPRRTISYLISNPAAVYDLDVDRLARIAWVCGYKLEIKLVKIE